MHNIRVQYIMYQLLFFLPPKCPLWTFTLDCQIALVSIFDSAFGEALPITNIVFTIEGKWELFSYEVNKEGEVVMLPAPPLAPPPLGKAHIKSKYFGESQFGGYTPIIDLLHLIAPVHQWWPFTHRFDNRKLSADSDRWCVTTQVITLIRPFPPPAGDLPLITNLNRWFCKFVYISVSTIDLLGPGQHWQNQQVSKCTLEKLAFLLLWSLHQHYVESPSALCWSAVGRG